MSQSHTGLASDVDREKQIAEQDTPVVDETDSAPKTLAELVKIADDEAEFQSAVRGPIKVPEWGGFEFYYRRLDASRQREVIGAYVEHGREDWAIFAERALNAKGERLFPQTIMLYVENLKRWNQDAMSRVVEDMATGSKTQLSDADLGK